MSTKYINWRQIPFSISLLRSPLSSQPTHLLISVLRIWSVHVVSGVRPTGSVISIIPGLPVIRPIVSRIVSTTISGISIISRTIPIIVDIVFVFATLSGVVIFVAPSSFIVFIILFPGVVWVGVPGIIIALSM